MPTAVRSADPPAAAPALKPAAWRDEPPQHVGVPTSGDEGDLPVPLYDTQGWLRCRADLAVQPARLAGALAALSQRIEGAAGDLAAATAAVRAVLLLTGDDDVAAYAQVHTAVPHTLVQFIRRWSGGASTEAAADALDAAAAALGNLAGSAVMNNGTAFSVLVAPLPLRPPASPHGRDGEVEAAGGALAEEAAAPVEVLLRAVSYVDGGLGSRLWDSGPVLAAYLVSAAGRARIRDRMVVELGAGLGLCGVAAARAGASSLVLTDYLPSLLANLEDVVAMQRPPLDAAVTVLSLDWRCFVAPPKADGGGAEQAGAAVPTEVRPLRRNADVVIGSDLVYDEVALSVPATVKYLLRPGGQFISLHPARHIALLPQFLHHCRAEFVGGTLTIARVDRQWREVPAAAPVDDTYWWVDWCSPAA